MDKHTFVGKRIPRLDAKQQISGKCKYIDDYFVPDMLYAQPKYSDYAFANIRAIDITEASQMPGVAGIILHSDVPCNEFGNGTPPDQRVLARDRVCYRGDCIAVVAAETKLQAEAAAKKILVEYEPLTPMLTVDEALAENAVPIHPANSSTNVAYHKTMSLGNPGNAFSEADYIVEGTYYTQKVDHTPIEPRGALAIPTPDGGVHIISTNSRVHNFLYPMTQIMQMPSSKLRISVPEGIGGSFGGKNDLLVEPWVALLALKTGRPVKLILCREEDLNTSTIRHAYKITHRTGIKKDGTIVVNEATMTADTGAYYAIGVGQLLKAAVHCCGPYHVPHQAVDASLVFTNTLIASAMRGMGVPQSCFAWESHLDVIAERIGMSPENLRRKNLFDEEGALVNGQVVPATSARACFEKALGLYRETETIPRKSNKLRGVGIANMIYPHDSCGPSGATSVIVRVAADGCAVVSSGLSDVGQGSKTALSQLTAEILGIGIEKVTFLSGDTFTTPYDEATGASRTIYFVGHCVQEAAEKARDMLLEAAGRMLGVPDAKKFRIKDGRIVLKTFPERNVSIAEAAFASERIHGRPIVATASYSSYSTPPSPENGHAMLFEAHTYGTQIAEIDVDRSTGEIDLLKMVAVHSCGRAINPMLVEGQIYGGVQMGIGYALMENLDEGRDGALLTNTFSEYHIPTAADMPKIFIADMVQLPVEVGPLGAGGMSEGAPSPTAAAIQNALHNATGLTYPTLPLTPERVLLGMVYRKEAN